MRRPGVFQPLGEKRQLRGGPGAIKPFQDNETLQYSRFHRAPIVMRTACLVIATNHLSMAAWEALITVCPAGNVTGVEITKSSGYTEIDASVEAALREFLFSQVDGRKDAVGTVGCRFRLEKQD
jgi:TonB family protein